MLRPEVVEEAHGRADEDGEARDGDGWLSLKLEERFEHGCGDAATTDAGDRAEGHDDTEDKEAADLEALLRENLLVLALVVVIAEEVRVVLAVRVYCARDLRSKNRYGHATHALQSIALAARAAARRRDGEQTQHAH